jgi:lipopolysaccharide transport system permease protein
LIILALREVSIRYKQTVLGITWVIIQPLITALIFALIFGKFAHLPSNGLPYLVFAYLGMVIWNVFSQGVDRASGSIIADERLVTKIFFPRWIIPLAAVLSLLPDFCIWFLFGFGLSLFYHLVPGWSLLLLPVSSIAVLLLASAVGLMIAGLNVKYRDFRHVVPFLQQVGLYASPVFYTTEIASERFRWIFYFNPLTGILELFRYSITGQGVVRWHDCGLSLFMALIIGVFCVLVFHRVEDEIADVI